MLGLDKLKKSSVYNIYVYSYSTNTTVNFPAFLTTFNDDFKSNWTTTTVLGKMDPIATYKNTARTINIGFDVPNESINEAKENMQMIDALIKGMYPVYSPDMVANGDSSKGKGTYTISSPPMFRVKFANLIINVPAWEYLANSKVPLLEYSKGLLCYIPDFKFNPDVPSGFFIQNDNIYPKLVKVSLTLNIIHEHPLGNVNNSVDGKGKPIPRLEDSNGKYSYSFPHGYDTRIANKDGNNITDTNNSYSSEKKQKIAKGILGSG